MAAIEVRGLRKVYGGIAAVDGIDLTMEEGDVVALLGPNGAGKTTTVEILEGYRARDGGTVSVLGYDPQTGGPRLPRAHRDRPAGGRLRGQLHAPRAHPPARRLLPAPAAPSTRSSP